MVDLDPRLGEKLKNDNIFQDGTLRSWIRTRVLQYAATLGLTQPRKNLGAPVSRDRCYILMVRSCLAVKAAQQDFNKFATDLISGLNMPECRDWTLG